MAARMKRRNNSSSGWIVLLLLALIASIAVLFGGDITGFAVLDTGGIWSQNSTVQLEQNVTLLRVSGSVSGTGNATMWLGGRLVFDSRQFTSSFENVCVDSCDSTDATDTLNIVVEGDAMLAITVFNYTEQNATQVNESLSIQPAEEITINETSTNETNTTNTTDKPVSTFEDVGIFASGTPPTIDNVTPVNSTRFNISSLITLSANITNDTAVYVIANLTYPNNNSFVQLVLAREPNTNVYNISYKLPAPGNYTLRIIANDSDNDYNYSEITRFAGVYDCAADIVNGTWAIGASTTITKNQTCRVINVSATLTVDSSATNVTVKLEAINVTVTSTGKITAGGKGYGRGAAAGESGLGPGGGGGSAAGGGIAGGGSHGGYGVTNGSTNAIQIAYGSIAEPRDLGSAGGSVTHADDITGVGGGAIFINATDTLNNSGVIDANGTRGIYAALAYPGGGAGGSLLIHAGTLKGNGKYQAMGGA
ncbi:hypothetical protein J4207_04300, partial [Candidatus Woesearchaeota archaeon]|nr:hypothetical protein [Candidatus Woesearchaeota archaeon]